MATFHSQDHTTEPLPLRAEADHEADPSPSPEEAASIEAHMGKACGEISPRLLLYAFVLAAYYLPRPRTVRHYCQGVAGAPSGNYLPSIKPIAMEIVCNFRGH